MRRSETGGDCSAAEGAFQAEHWSSGPMVMEEHAMQVQAETYVNLDGVEKSRISTSGMAPIIVTSRSGGATGACI